jgi:hypothetical protein
MVFFLIFDTACLHYSTIQPQILLTLITFIYVIATGFALFTMQFRAGMIVSILLSSAVLIWYIQDKPSNHRDWALEYAIPATVSINGQNINFNNIRDFRYRSETDAIPHYYNASFRLDQLSGVDLISSYWAGDTIAHIFLTFDFQDGRHLAMSIETRRQKRFAYSTIAGFFHHYELFYVVADERDLIGVRTDIRHERVYLYELQISSEKRQILFMSYVNQIQKLSGHPEWYNTLTDNCMTGILKRAGATRQESFNWRVILSGYAPEYAYQRGFLNSSVSFKSLKDASLIVRPKNAEITDTYSADIRKNLPLYAPPPQP